MSAVWGEDVLKIGAGEPDVFSRMIKDVIAHERHAVYEPPHGDAEVDARFPVRPRQEWG